MDLVGALLAVSLGEEVAAAAPGRPDVRTHQLLLAVLGAADQGRGRRGVARELAAAAAHRGAYRASREELTPLRRDPLAAVPVLAAAAATLAWPPAARWFAAGAVSSYALTPQGWAKILGTAAAMPSS